MTIMMNKRFFWAMATAFTRWDSTAQDNIKIYKGTMPADADSYDPASPTYTVDELVTFTTWNLSTPTGSDNQDAAQGRCEFTPTTGFPTPSTVNATGAGTAAWYAMYRADQLSRILLGDVTLSGGTGSLFLDSLGLTIGNPVTIINWGIHFKS